MIIVLSLPKAPCFNSNFNGVKCAYAMPIICSVFYLINIVIA